MDSETLQRAREPFFTTKGPGKGTGLGLSMVHGLAEQSGGHFRLKSRPGVGTTAELFLPLAKRSASTPRARESVPEPEDWRTRVVLAVDDDILVLTNTIAMLEDLGHVAIAAHSGSEALALLEREEKIDLLLTDHAMPHMNGSELAKLARQQRPGLPIVLTTGYAELDEADAAQWVRLAKPFTQAELARAISAACPRGGDCVVQFPRPRKA